MDTTFPLIFAAVVGFGHAFEADHLVAVSNIVTKRKNPLLAIKDGLYWGLGHTSTIFFIGTLMIVGKATFLNGYFGYFEALVGLMLVLLGLFRLFRFFRGEEPHTHHDHHDHKQHHLAYGVGLVHGLAGSGAMILLVMTEIQSKLTGILYLLLLGLGSALGMLVAAGLFSLPFSKRLTGNQNLQTGLILLSSLLCIGFGAYILVENLR